MGRPSKIELAFRQMPSRATPTTFVRMFAGDLLGVGVFRRVYVFKPDPRFVIKWEHDPTTGQFANVCEWRNWVDHEAARAISKWLAPCQIISETGHILLQRRVRFRNPEFYPKKLPSFLSDFKYSNYGWIGQRFVCCDYAALWFTKKWRDRPACAGGELKVRAYHKRRRSRFKEYELRQIAERAHELKRTVPGIMNVTIAQRFDIDAAFLGRIMRRFKEQNCATRRENETVR